jgi:hypothetical protein
MAYEIPVFKPGTFTAATDLSTKQFYCVKLNTTNNQVALCNTDGEKVFSVLQNEPESGQSAELIVSGITKVLAGETLTAGMFWGTDSSGKAKQVEHTATGADTGDWAVGEVIEGASANEYATVTIGLFAYRVTA